MSDPRYYTVLGVGTITPYWEWAQPPPSSASRGWASLNVTASSFWF